MRDKYEMAELEYDRFQSLADVEYSLVKEKALEMAATYPDDALLNQMVRDRIDNNEKLKAAILAAILDHYEGPYPDGKHYLTPNIRRIVDEIAIQRFERMALDQVRDSI